MHLENISVTTVCTNNTSALLVANWDHLMKISLKRSSLVLPQIAVISIIQHVLQSFSTMVIKSKRKNFKPKFLLKILFSVLYTYAKSVRQVKTKIYLRCILLYADVVQLLITENVYLERLLLNSTVTR